jgi:hypothetical protein
MLHKSDILKVFRQELYNYLNLRNNLNKAKQDKLLSKLIKTFGKENEIKFLQGGLYELYIGVLLLDTNIDDLEVSSIIQDNYGNKNEFDILFMKNNHLHMIECKLANPNISDLIYKYTALKELLDNDGKMAIFTRHNDYYRTTQANQKNDLAPKNRAKANSILLRGLIYENEDKFYNDLESFFDVKEYQNEKK